MGKDVGMSEARRRLPALVRRIASEGGRVDISYRGKPQASLLRISDVRSVPSALGTGPSLHPALRVELAVPDGELVGVIRGIRAEQGQPRTAWLAASEAAKRGRRRKKAARQRR